MSVCRLTADLASDHLDGRLTADERELYLSHIAVCRECAHRHEELTALRSLLAATPAPQPPIELEGSLLQRLAEREASPWQRLLKAIAGHLPPFGLVPSTAGAAALLLLTIGLLPVGAPVPEPAATLETSRQAVLTVWDTRLERIVAEFDPSGLHPCGERDESALCPASSATYQSGTRTHRRGFEVRMYLYEHIEVKG